MFNRKAKRPTALEAERMAKIKGMPCICCQIAKKSVSPGSEVHHLLSGNKRRGHMFTIPLCGWHHRGSFRSPFFARKEIAQMYGPSLADGSKPFHAAFGDDNSLLARTNKLLEAL